MLSSHWSVVVVLCMFRSLVDMHKQSASQLHISGSDCDVIMTLLSITTLILASPCHVITINTAVNIKTLPTTHQTYSQLVKKNAILVMVSERCLVPHT